MKKRVGENITRHQKVARKTGGKQRKVKEKSKFVAKLYVG